MARGRRLKVRAGSVLVYGSPPFGYTVIERDGKYELEICESEARTVRLVFSWYTEGDIDGQPMTLNDIVRKLSEMKVPSFADTHTRSSGTPKKRARGEWGRSTVYKMLKNETYAGTWHFGKKKRRNGHWVQTKDDPCP